MFEELIGGQTILSCDKNTVRHLTDRLNMGRLYMFNIIGCVSMLILTAVFSLFNFYILPHNYQSFGFLMLAAIMALSAATVLVTTRTHRTELFEPLTLAYLGVLSVVLYNFAFRADSSPVAIIIYWAIMTIIGLVPVLGLGRFLIVWAVELVPMIVMAIVRHFTADAITSVITISVMGFMLSLVSYLSIMRKLNYKLQLDSALSEAETDSMTQLLNRRGLQRRIENIWPHCIRQNTDVAILMLDIDNFKKYNDNFGHAEGDECIRKVSGAIRRSVKRRTDYAARVGGEEFLVFLTGIDAKQAVKWALELKQSIDALKIPHAPSNFSRYVSVSMGLACINVKGDITFEKLREEADKSLYEAKYNGRACLYFRHKCFGKQSVYKKAGNE